MAKLWMAWTLGAVGALACASCGCEGEPSPSDATALESSLRRNSVHFHLALRDALEGPDAEARAAELLAAAESDEGARRLAERLYEARDDGAAWLEDDRRPEVALTQLLVEEAELDGPTDQGAFLMALLLEDSRNDAHVPNEILVFEASRLTVDAIDDPLLRASTRAGRAVVYARADLCTLAEAEAEELRRTIPSESAMRRSLPAVLGEDGPDADQVAGDLSAAMVVLGDSARACCLMHRNDTAGAIDAVDGLLDEAETLGIEPAQVAILRGWAALARSDEDEARAQLRVIRESDLRVEDRPKYRMLRDALASGSDRALEDARAQLIDQRWLSALMLRAVRQTLERDGLLDALTARPEAQALVAAAQGHAAVVEAARDRYPMFDQAHQGDRGPLERLADLFD